MQNLETIIIVRMTNELQGQACRDNLGRTKAFVQRTTTPKQLCNGFFKITALVIKEKLLLWSFGLCLLCEIYVLLVID